MKTIFFLLTLFCSTPLLGASPDVSANKFMYRIQHYYCDADWICKNFEEMTLPEFIVAWQQLVGLLSSERMRWFYAHDNNETYVQRMKAFFGNFDRYNRESVDVEWITECQKYHKFLVSHYYDGERDLIVEKKDEKNKKPLRLKKRYTQLQEAVCQSAPEAYFTFYMFFFEQLANVMLKKLNYVYQEQELDSSHLLQIMKHKEEMTYIYQVCLHKTKQASEVYAHKMAYHYNRIESLLEMVFSEFLKRLGLEHVLQL